MNRPPGKALLVLRIAVVVFAVLMIGAYAVMAQIRAHRDPISARPNTASDSSPSSVDHPSIAGNFHVVDGPLPLQPPPNLPIPQPARGPSEIIATGSKSGILSFPLPASKDTDTARQAAPATATRASEGDPAVPGHGPNGKRPTLAPGSKSTVLIDLLAIPTPSPPMTPGLPSASGAISPQKGTVPTAPSTPIPVH